MVQLQVFERDDRYRFTAEARIGINNEEKFSFNAAAFRLFSPDESAEYVECLLSADGSIVGFRRATADNRNAYKLTPHTMNPARKTKAPATRMLHATTFVKTVRKMNGLGSKGSFFYIPHLEDGVLIIEMQNPTARIERSYGGRGNTKEKESRQQGGLAHTDAAGD